MWPQLLSPCADCTLEAQPKYVRGGKRYGRRSLPEFQESVEEFAEVTVIEPLDEEAQPSHIPASERSEVRDWTDTSTWTTGVETCGHPHPCGANTGGLRGLWLFSATFFFNYMLILLLAFWISMTAFSIVYMFHLCFSF